MDVLSAAELLARKKLIEGVFDRMTDEERRLLIQLVYQQKSSSQIMAALGKQSKDIREVRDRQQTFLSSLSSNVAGNAVWAGAAWLLRRLAMALK